MRLSSGNFISLLAITSVTLLPLGCSSSSGKTEPDSGPPADTGTADHHTTTTDAGHDAGHHDGGMTHDAESDVTTASDTGTQDVGTSDAPADVVTHDAPVDSPVITMDGSHAEGGKDAADHDAGKDSGKDSGSGATKEAYHLIGRWDTTTTAATMTSANAVGEWPGSGVKATFNGPNISVDLLEAPNAGGGYDSIAVEIDGKYVTTFALDSTNAGCTGGECIFILASGLTTGVGVTHTVAFYKTTDSFYGGSITFKSFVPAGNGAMVPAVYTFPHQIEFIGDDIAAGRGVLDATMAQCAIVNGVPGIPNSVSTEYDSYAALIAQNYGAERQNLSICQVGVVDGNGSMSQLMPAVYGQVLPSESTNLWSADPLAASWQPELVVVNLGGYGDFANTTDSFDPPLSGADMTFETTLESGYETFLLAVRKAHPTSFILVVAGNGFAGDIDPAIASTIVGAVVTDMQTSHNETTATMGFYSAPIQSAYTCDFYPNQTDQQTMATELEGVIHTALNW